MRQRPHVVSVKMYKLNYFFSEGGHAMTMMNELAVDWRGKFSADSMPIATSDVNVDEFGLLLDAAEAVLLRARTTGSNNVLAIDIVRDVLLNCGGLGHAPSSTDLQHASCEASYTRLSQRRAHIPSYLLASHGPVILGDTYIARVEEEQAIALHEGLHYLGSARPGGLHLGLFAPEPGNPLGVLIALASLHAFDLTHLVPNIIGPDEVRGTRILSRTLALPGAPRNTMSRLLGCVFAWLRLNEPPVTTLITYNNPNLGFRGTIYRATNWTLADKELKRTDMLLDGAYISLRELRARFGSFEYEDLVELLGDRLEPLPPAKQPLQIFVYRLHSNWLDNARLQVKQ